MDNGTYEGLDLTPINTDETYSRLRTTQTNNKPSYEPQRRANIESDENTTKGTTNIDTKDSQTSVKFNVVLIIAMAVLLLLTVMSIALSVTTYSQLTSEQSRVLDQINSTNNKISQILEIITIQYNVSQNDIELVQTQLAATQTNISNTLIQLDDRFSASIFSVLHPQSYCGPGPWYRVAYLNMSNPAERCPSAWREYNRGGVRACKRPFSGSRSCPGVQYSACHQYRRVCGRIIGYQVESPDAFKSTSDRSVDGVTITHGTQHIWSYVAGLTELSTSMQHPSSTCPCSNTDGQAPPPSIGNNYYCESGNSMSDFRRDHLYQDDELWDGQQCEGTCCTGTNSPPWFSLQLPAPTTDAIEVSICCDQGTHDEDIPVKLIEIFVQ
jgi:hypothetical protein